MDVLAIALAIMGIVSFFGWWLPEHLERRKVAAARAERQPDEPSGRRADAGPLRRQWEAGLQAMTLSCDHCGKVALPIPGTSDRYVCPSCGHRFVGARHDVPLPPAARNAPKPFRPWIRGIRNSTENGIMSVALALALVSAVVSTKPRGLFETAEQTAQFMAIVAIQTALIGATLGAMCIGVYRLFGGGSKAG